MKDMTIDVDDFADRLRKFLLGEEIVSIEYPRETELMIDTKKGVRFYINAETPLEFSVVDVPDPEDFIESEEE